MEDCSDYHLFCSFDSSVYLGVAIPPVSPAILCRGCCGVGVAVGVWPVLVYSHTIAVIFEVCMLFYITFWRYVEKMIRKQCIL